MNSQQSIRKEILRLVQTQHNSACINTRRLAMYYNMPEREVRRELTRMAEEKIIQLSGWDGHSMRPYREWPTADEFVNSKADDGQVHVSLEVREKAAAATA